MCISLYLPKIRKSIFLKHHLKSYLDTKWASHVVLVVKNLPVNAGDIRDMGLVPESVRFPGGGHGNPFQYSYLENPMDK